MAQQTCASCFAEMGYFERIYPLTQRRLDAVRQLQVTVLSAYMKTELVRAGVPADQVSVQPPFVHDLDARAQADGPAPSGGSEVVTWSRSFGGPERDNIENPLAILATADGGSLMVGSTNSFTSSPSDAWDRSANPSFVSSSGPRFSTTHRRSPTSGACSRRPAQPAPG